MKLRASTLQLNVRKFFKSCKNAGRSNQWFSVREPRTPKARELIKLQARN
jgi:hypothetical protein